MNIILISINIFITKVIIKTIQFNRIFFQVDFVKENLHILQLSFKFFIFRSKTIQNNQFLSQTQLLKFCQYGKQQYKRNISMSMQANSFNKTLQFYQLTRFNPYSSKQLNFLSQQRMKQNKKITNFLSSNKIQDTIKFLSIVQIQKLYIFKKIITKTINKLYIQIKFRLYSKKNYQNLIIIRQLFIQTLKKICILFKDHYDFVYYQRINKIKNSMFEKFNNYNQTIIQKQKQQTVVLDISPILNKFIIKQYQQNKQLSISYIQNKQINKQKDKNKCIQMINDSMSCLKINQCQSLYQNHCQGQKCFGCLKNFNQDELIKINQKFTVINLKQNFITLQKRIKQKACALLNNGGGYLVFSKVQYFKQGIKLFGSFFDSEKHILDYKLWIQNMIINGIFPQSEEKYLNSQFFTINTKQVQNYRYSNNYLIICALIPQKQYLFFVINSQTKNKHYVPKFISKKMQINNGEDISRLKYLKDQYNLILDKFYYYKRKQRFKLQRKYPIKSQQKCIDYNKQIKQMLWEYSYISQIDELPNIVYQYQSILILNQKDSENFIERIQRGFNNKKIKLYICLPYKTYQDLSYKKKYFLSCQSNFQDSHNVINQILNKKYLAHIGISKYLYISNIQVKAIKPFFQDFQNKYQRNITYAWNLSKNDIIQNIQEAYDLCFKLFNYDEYSLRIRADFVNQNKFKKMDIINIQN